MLKNLHGYLGGYKQYKVDKISGLYKTLGNIANSVMEQMEKEAIEIARETIEEEIYSRPESSFYNRSGEIAKTPKIYNKWKNAYGSGFALGYDATILTTAPGGFRNKVHLLPRHQSLGGEDVRDYIMGWLDDGFRSMAGCSYYEPTHFSDITKEKIRQRMMELINS